LEASGELSDRIVDAWRLAIVGSIAAGAGGETAGRSGVLRSGSVLGSLAGIGLGVDSGAATEVSRTGFAGASTVGAATDRGSAGTAPAAVGAARGGSKVSGSTYPCGSLVTRAPK
jgi:hypothetical protein